MSSKESVEASTARFNEFASITGENGQKYLSLEDFLHAIAPQNENYKKISRQSYEVLFSVADHNKQGRVSLKDWIDFEQVLDRPDAEYQIAFRVFDKDGHGFVDFKEFVETYNSYKSSDSLPFDWNASWAKLYIGEGGNRHSMSYGQFSQMLRGIVGERIRQAFMFYDKSNSGFITPTEFETIIRKTAAHKLSDALLDDLTTIVSRPSSTSRKVSYATVRAFLNLINNVELAQMTARMAANDKGEFTRKEFMDAAASFIKFVTITPLEVDLLFHFAHTGSPEKASLDNIERLFDPSWEDARTRYLRSTIEMADAAKNVTSDPRSFLSEVFESVYNFTLGSVAGAIGATVVYPIDLVKTRMQNQRKTPPGQAPLYSNSWDCFKKVIAREGFKGLYSGLGPQLIGVAPEKAIKLTVNDLVRGRLTREDGTIALPSEILAGGAAGACQVIFTNPLEIVKIRLQIQGEVARAEGIPKKSAVFIVRQLGLVGLYRGATACLLRDVPFSAIYFPTYAHLKRDTFGEGTGKKLHVWELLTAGAIAGIPAAYLTTPADVIKTRLQVEARPGVKAYNGVFDAAGRILREEGFSAFFKGGPARILRSSPQFGTTLAAYEVLKRLVPFPGSDNDTSEAGHKVPTAYAQRQSPVKYLRSRNSLKLLLDIDENFGKPWTNPNNPLNQK